MRVFRLVTMKRVSGPSAPASTRAMIRSTRLQLAAPSKNSLKRRALPSFGAASKRAFVLASRSLDMPAQCRGRRDAQDVIETVGPTPVENLGTAIVTVGAQQDLGLRPVGADCAQQAAQEGANLLAAGPFGGTKNGGDEAALAIEHDDRLKAVFVVMRIEQPQLLAAMNRVERVVDVERDPLGNPLEGLAIKIDHGAAHAQQGASIGQVFKTRDRRLRTQFAIRWR